MISSVELSGSSETNRSLATLPSYRTDWTDAQFSIEMTRIRQATAVERDWFKQTNYPAFMDDAAIEDAVSCATLVKINPRQGLFPIWRLLHWTSDRSDPTHPFYYSPPYARPEVSVVLDFVADAWIRRRDTYDDGSYHLLPITSLVRSTQYQTRLSESAGRRIAIDPASDGFSSHQYGFAFDIDASGVYRYKPGSDEVAPINPFQPGYQDAAGLVARGRDVLRDILDELASRQIINVCEEVPETREWCFHVCVNPTIMLDEVLK